MNDLYDLSTFRYELDDVSAANAAVTSDLAGQLSVQAIRTGTTYDSWADGDPLLADPFDDADLDGVSNAHEYASGTSALDPTSAPGFELSTDLHGDPVFSFISATAADDLIALPTTSTDLFNWSTDSLKFLTADPLGNNLHRLSFRLSTPPGNRHFFRTSLLE